MSRGPGKVERRLSALLADPSRNSWRQQELIRAAFGMDSHDTPTDAQRVSAGRALRKLLAASKQWRVTASQPFDAAGNHLIRDRPAQRSDGKVSIWAYRYTARRVEWRTATIVRRTRTRCTVAFDGEEIVTDTDLDPIGQSDGFDSLFETEWRFKHIRSRFIEAEVELGWRWWRHKANLLDEMAGGRWSSELQDREDDAVARSLLGLGSTFTGEELESAFRKAQQRHHPDHGGDDAVARTLVMARDALKPRVRSR